MARFATSARTATIHILHADRPQPEFFYLELDQYQLQPAQDALYYRLVLRLWRARVWTDCFVGRDSISTKHGPEADASFRPVLTHCCTLWVGNKLFRLKQAVLEYTALIDPVAVGVILGDADRAWVEAADVGVSRGGLQDFPVRVPIDQSRACRKRRKMVHRVVDARTPDMPMGEEELLALGMR